MKQTTTENTKEKIPPVKIGQLIDTIPTGMAERDPYLKYNDFIVFIKRLPPNLREKKVRIKITEIKKTFAFAEYQQEVE